MSPIDTQPIPPEAQEGRPAAPENAEKEQQELDRRAEALRTAVTEELTKSGGLTEARWKELYERTMKSDPALAAALEMRNADDLRAFLAMGPQAYRGILTGTRNRGEVILVMSYRLAELKPEDIRPEALRKEYGDNLVPSLMLVEPALVFGKLAPLVENMPEREAVRAHAARSIGGNAVAAAAFLASGGPWMSESDAGTLLSLICRNMSTAELEQAVKGVRPPIDASRLASARLFMNKDWTENRPESSYRLTWEPVTAKRMSVFEDPALAALSQVDESWLDWSRVPQDPRWLQFRKIQMRASIARNLFFRGEPVTPDSARREFSRILETRERLAKTPLFAGRTILLAAHGETSETGAPKFGNDELSKAIREQQGPGRTFSRIRPDAPADAGKAKRDTLAGLRSATPPFTFMFDGHGGPEGLYFAQGIPGPDGSVDTSNPDGFISPRELADAFKERQRTFGARLAETPDILVLAACYTSDFMRAFFRELGDTPKPIIIGASEYGQVAYGSSSHAMGSHFHTAVLGLGEAGPSTLGRAMQMDRAVDRNGLRMHSRTVVYVPDEENRPSQIAQSGGGTPAA